MKVYLIEWDNNEAWDDNMTGVSHACISQEVADSVILKLREKQAKTNDSYAEQGHNYRNDYTWRVIPMEVLGDIRDLILT